MIDRGQRLATIGCVPAGVSVAQVTALCQNFNFSPKMTFEQYDRRFKHFIVNVTMLTDKEKAPTQRERALWIINLI
ncbi:hypothetical protein GCM10007390_46440 [Persicitalea jodogahamensis]|uniref:Uncharacterized protein n=1 Tax=Persicitalea jodogahamensis TaxID=402147 RepID=A0A8J3D5F1_9BACT|nr:hypothetical protein GCM10007390_46440 [Persicitalea jodogahamensis]